MTNLKNWLHGIGPDTQKIIARFPLTIALVCVLTIVLLIESNTDLISNERNLQLMGGIVLAAYLALITALYNERNTKKAPFAVQAIIVMIALLAGYFYKSLAYIPPMAIGAAILALGNSPFIKKGRDDIGVWHFTHKLWTAVLFTTAGSIIYVLGVFAISGALKSLFSVNINDLVENWLLPIGLGFLAPLAWLSMLPTKDDDDSDSLRNPGFISRAVGFLGTWILAPLTLIYAVIILAYGLKILIMRQLPNGEIALLVTPFLIIGTLTWLILDPPFIRKKSLARWYRRIWFPVMIPAALLLAVAAGVRIGEYGLTIERYLLVIAVIWALGTAAWFTFMPKKRRDIRIIPGFAATLLAVCSIGPWGADGLSTINQDARLKSALIANHMLSDNGTLKPYSELTISDKAAAKRAKGALLYLIKTKKTKRIIAYLPADDDTKIWNEQNDGYKGRRGPYLNSAAINKRFALETVVGASRFKNNINSSISFNDRDHTLNVSGYDFLSKPYTFLTILKSTNTNTITTLGDFTLVQQGSAILLKRGEEQRARLDIEDWILKQEATYVQDNNGQVKRVDPISLYQTDTIAIIIVPKSFNFYERDDGNSRINMQFRLLTRGIKMD